MHRRLIHRSSLIANVLLAAAAVALALPRPGAVSPGATPPAAGKLSPAEAANPAPDAGRPHFAAGQPSPDRRRWLVDELRALGVSNHVLARIVLADLDAEWTRHAAKVAIECHGDSDTMAALQLKIDQSRDDEMRAALGEDGFRQWDRENMLREADAGGVPLSVTESEAAYALWKRLQSAELALKAARVHRTMDEASIGDAYGVAVTAFNQQMKALLGDERYAKSQQTDDATAAAGLREEVAGANPTESQFQDLLQAQQRLNGQRAALDRQFPDKSAPAYAEQVKALNDAREQEYQRVLGLGAFDALQKAQDPGYNQMKKNAALWGLDDAAIDDVYGTMKYYARTVQQYEGETRAREAQGLSVDWDAVHASLQRFTEQTRLSLQDSLGTERFNQLTRNNVFRFNEIAPQ